jgi:hypothetical protein
MKGSVADTRGGGLAVAHPNNFSKPLNDSWLTVKQSHIKDFMINKSLIGYILSKFAWNLGGGKVRFTAMNGWLYPGNIDLHPNYFVKCLPLLTIGY